MSEDQRQGLRPPDGKKAAPVTMDHVLSALQETEEEREIRIRTLFNFFDVENLGTLDYGLIEAGLSAMHIPAEYKYAKDLLSVCDSNRDGRVDYQEFRRYMDDKELELYRIFQAIDVEHNGCILPEELWDALVKAGIDINEDELASFVEHVDKDNNGIITFEEWRDFLLLYPHEATLENIYHYWERIYLVDIGEQAVIPEGIGKHVHASKYLIAGAVAGIASRTATAPLDRLKVIMQVQISHVSVIQAIKTIWREGGFLGFFRGKEKDDIGTSGRLIAGGMAGAVAQAAIYPMDLVKTRLQTAACDGRKAPSLVKLTKDIWVHGGPRAFYRGLIPSLLGMIPYAGIDLAVYEKLKDMSKRYILHDAEPGPLVHLGCGTVSGALGATCVYPLQVIRTRLQAQHTGVPAAYRGMSDVFRRTLKHEGLRGFYKGLVPNLLKVVPAASITYLVYETMKKSLDIA